jgi:hypothetical protein
VIDLMSANHTGRELELMLTGKKPLAMFYAFLEELPNEALIPEELFAKHVFSGKLIRGETILIQEPNQKLKEAAQLKYVFFALENEA